MQTVLVPQGQGNLLCCVGINPRLCIFQGWLRLIKKPQLFLLGEQCAACFLAGCFQITSQTGLDPSGDSTFDQWRRAESDFLLHRWGKQFDRHFCAEDRAAQVHEQQHTVIVINLLDGLHDLQGVRSKLIVILSGACSDSDPDWLCGYLLNEVCKRLPERFAVRNQNYANHHIPGWL